MTRAQAERWFLNRKRATEDAAFDPERWAALAHRHAVDPDTLITIGVHGSRFDDALVLVATATTGAPAAGTARPAIAWAVAAVLAAGGPNAGGSFRSVQVIRNGRVVADYDLYALIRSGDRSRDPILQNEDVLFIPVGKGVAVAVIVIWVGPGGIFF